MHKRLAYPKETLIYLEKEDKQWNRQWGLLKILRKQKEAFGKI